MGRMDRREEAIELEGIQPRDPGNEFASPSASCFVHQLPIGPKTHDGSLEHAPDAGHVLIERFRRGTIRDVENFDREAEGEPRKRLRNRVE